MPVYILSDRPNNRLLHPSVDSAYGADDATVQSLIQKAADYALLKI
jgi:hypothetical protein